MLLGTVGAADVSRHLASEGAQAAEQEPQHDMVRTAHRALRIVRCCEMGSN